MRRGPVRPYRPPRRALERRRDEAQPDPAHRRERDPAALEHVDQAPRPCVAEAQPALDAIIAELARKLVRRVRANEFAQGGFVRGVLFLFLKKAHNFFTG